MIVYVIIVMVFVNNLTLWLSFSLVVACVIIFSYQSAFYRNCMSYADLWMNTLVVFSLISLLMFFSIDTVILISAVLVLKLVNHEMEAANAFEKNFNNLAPSRRVKIFESLAKEEFTITDESINDYFWALVTAESFNFKEWLPQTINEVQLGFFLKHPVERVSPFEHDFYKLKLKYFKYKIVEEPKVEEFCNDEEALKLKIFWSKARNPKLNFVLVSHLPINLKYSFENSNNFRLILTNVAVLYNFFKSTIVSLLLMILYFIYTVFFFKIQFLKQLAVWFVIGMIYFWLMSGFNFFLKRYQFSKFTSQIQRFWKRTNTCFWLIEGFLILLFFYYFLNSSQEPLYMYDYSALNQEYLVSLQSIAVNIILLSVIIYFMYFTLLRINSNSWQQLNLYLVVISSFIFFSFFIETYQFYYVVSTFNERLWVFNEEDNLWQIDIENPILRTKQDYLLVCLIAKYWHFLFIFLSWVFFLIKSFERRKLTYVLFGVNLQNMLILYVLNFACYLQWAKWVYRRFFDLPYTWFMTNIDNRFFNRYFFELKLLISNILNTANTNVFFENTAYKSLAMWNVDSLALWKFI